VTDLTGKTTGGIHLNEDEYSVHLRDTAGNLRSFMKSELKEMTGVELTCREVKNGRIYPTPSYTPSIYRVVLGSPIEQQAEWVWTAVEPQEIGTRAVPPASAAAHRKSHNSH